MLVLSLEAGLLDRKDTDTVRDYCQKKQGETVYSLVSLFRTIWRPHRQKIFRPMPLIDDSLLLIQE